MRAPPGWTEGKKKKKMTRSGFTNWSAAAGESDEDLWCYLLVATETKRADTVGVNF